MIRIIIAVMVCFVKIAMEDALRRSAVYHGRQELKEIADQDDTSATAYQAAMSHSASGFTWQPNRLGFASMVAV